MVVMTLSSGGPEAGGPEDSTETTGVRRGGSVLTVGCTGGSMAGTQAGWAGTSLAATLAQVLDV